MKKFNRIISIVLVMLVTALLVRAQKNAKLKLTANVVKDSRMEVSQNEVEKIPGEADKYFFWCDSGLYATEKGAGPVTPFKFEERKVRFQRITRTPKIPLLYGFIDTKTGAVVEGIFLWRDLNRLFFDPVSKLSYACVFLKKDGHGGEIFREGYIDEQGVFMIVKGETSKW